MSDGREGEGTGGEGRALRTFGHYLKLIFLQAGFLYIGAPHCIYNWTGQLGSNRRLVQHCGNLNRVGITIRPHGKPNDFLSIYIVFCLVFHFFIYFVFL